MKIIIIGAIITFIVGFFIYMLLNDGDDYEKSIKVGYIPIADCSQLYVAIENKYFEDEGINVELVKLAGGAKILEALAGGSVDIGFSNVISLILASNQGLDFISIAGGSVEDDLHKFSGILTLNDSDIYSIEDLRGKTIAVNTKKNIVDFFLLDILERYNINEDEVRISEIPFPNMEKVMLTSEIDAIAVVEPFVTFAIENGSSRRISDLFTSTNDYIEVACYNASKKWVLENSKLLNKFNNAFGTATNFIENNEDSTKTIISKYTSLSKEQLINITLPAFVDSFDDERLQLICDDLNNRGWITDKIDASELIWD